MRKAIVTIYFPALAVFFLYMAVSAGSAFSAENGKLTVFVSILPQKYFVEKIGGDRVDVHVMVKPGASPAVYEPRPLQMEILSTADVYFAIGVPFEKVWLDRLSAANPGMRIVATYAGTKRFEMGKDRHGGGHSHSFDPHIWTSPPLVTLQARHILTTLQKLDPANYQAYEKNFKGFVIEIVDLDADIRGHLKELAHRRFMVFHPSWRYFADAYDLEQIPVEKEGDSPKPAELIGLIEQARTHQIDTVFVQPQFSDKSARLIAGEIGGDVVTADPLAPDWAENLRHVARELAAALGDKNE